MNGYLEMKVSELRQTWDNYTKAKAVTKVKFDRLEKAYKEEFGHPLEYEKGEGGHNLWKELMKCKENKQSRCLPEDESESLCKLMDGGISLFFDPPTPFAEQRRVIETILTAASDENAKVAVDIDLCDFIRRWKTGGSFMK